MYQDYEIVGFSGKNHSDNDRSYIVRITDDDFVVDEKVFPGPNTSGIDVSPELAVIQCYSKRGLSVAPNLIRHMLKVRDEQRWSLDGQTLWQKTFNPRWKEVEEAMKMYLTFS